VAVAVAAAGVLVTPAVGAALVVAVAAGAVVAVAAGTDVAVAAGTVVSVAVGVAELLHATPAARIPPTARGMSHSLCLRRNGFIPRALRFD